MVEGRTLFIIVGTVLVSGVALFVFVDGSREKVLQHIDTSSGSEALSAEEYFKVRDHFFAVVDNVGVRRALEEVRERIVVENDLLRSCHALAHEIGHKAYKKYGGFAEALEFQDEICNSGYLHGVIESHFEKNGAGLETMSSVCDAYRIGSYQGWECYHGVGHGLMYYTKNDLPKSLAMCNSYDADFARSNRANGVFMENFNTDQKLHPSRFLKEDDLFYPCAEQAESHKSICYLYAPTFYLSKNHNDYMGALLWCKDAEKPYQSTCVEGVGSQAVKENINDPLLVEAICMLDPEYQQSCIAGMIGLYINHYGSLGPAKRLCGQLELLNRPMCYLRALESASMFTL